MDRLPVFKALGDNTRYAIFLELARSAAPLSTADIAAALARHGELKRAPLTEADVFGLREVLTPDGDVRTLPCHLAAEGGMDGFYAARLVKAL